MRMRISALLLAALMLFSLAACATTPSDTPDDGTKPGETTAAPETTVPEETELTPDIPDVGDKYKGTEFIILHRGMDVSTYKDRWNYAEAPNGETVNDAVFKRNAAVEEKFGIVITSVTDGKPHELISTAMASGDDLYDIAYPIMQYIRPYLLQGVCYNLLDETISANLGFDDKPWWDPYVNEAFTYKDKLFVSVSDANLCPGTLARGTIFNRDLAKEYKLDDPYELVKNNQWTTAKFAEMVLAVADDANGNSQHDDEDVYGMLTEIGGSNGNAYNLVIGGGVTMFAKDKDENVSIEFMNERTMGILDILRTFLEEQNVARSYDELGTAPAGYNKYQYGRLLFSQDHFLFYEAGATGIYELITNNMESEYGMVPRPKFDAEQERYYNQTDVNAAVYCIPATNSPDDLERISIITEFMAYTSSKTVLPAFYDTLVDLRFARSPELGEMVDLIKNSIYYDITTLYGLNHAPIIDNAFWSGQYGSIFASSKPTLEAEITKLGEKLSVLD